MRANKAGARSFAVGKTEVVFPAGGKKNYFSERNATLCMSRVIQETKKYDNIPCIN